MRDRAAGPSRLKSPQNKASSRNVPSPSPRSASPPLGMGHILSHIPGPGGVPDLLCPTEEPAQVCCGSSKETDFNAHTTHITTGGTRPLPRNPSRPSAAKCSHPWPSSCLQGSWLGLLLHRPCLWLQQNPHSSVKLSGWSSREALFGRRAGEGRAWGQGASPKAHQSSSGEPKTSRSRSSGHPWRAHLSLSETSHRLHLSPQSPCAGRGKNRSGGGGRST